LDADEVKEEPSENIMKRVMSAEASQYVDAYIKPMEEKLLTTTPESIQDPIYDNKFHQVTAVLKQYRINQFKNNGGNKLARPY
jgi:hypothetical protein